MRAAIILIAGILIWQMSGCKNNQPITSESNDWNTGSMTLPCDTNLQPVFDQMKPVYENSYPQAVINFQYRNEEDLIRDFVDGIIKAMAISRNLTNSEIQQAAIQQKIEIREHVFAYDAIAVIAAPNFMDTILALEAIPGYLEKDSPVKLVFDNAYSGIAKQVMQVCRINPGAFQNAYVVKNPQAVIDYVAGNPQAIGFIPYNFISNSYESADLANRKKIKLLSLSKRDTLYSLSQEDIAYSAYPFTRPLNMVLGNNPDLVGRGFTNFLHRSQAARILLKSGLVPKNLPVRQIRVRESLNAE
jgi:phosphate transport system substrate-binding protein